MPEFINKVEALKRTGLSHRTLQRRLDLDEIPLYQDPLDRRRRLLAVEDVDRLVTPTPYERHRRLIESVT